MIIHILTTYIQKLLTFAISYFNLGTFICFIPIFCWAICKQTLGNVISSIQSLSRVRLFATP